MVKIFLSEDKIYTFIIWLKPTVQATVAHEIEELDDERRSVEKFIQIAWIEGDAYRARLKTPAANCENFYVSSRSDQDDKEHSLITYSKWSYHAYRGLQKQVTPLPRVSGPIRDYRCDRSE